MSLHVFCRRLLLPVLVLLSVPVRAAPEEALSLVDKAVTSLEVDDPISAVQALIRATSPLRRAWADELEPKLNDPPPDGWAHTRTVLPPWGDPADLELWYEPTPSAHPGHAAIRIRFRLVAAGGARTALERELARRHPAPPDEAVELEEGRGLLTFDDEHLLGLLRKPLGSTGIRFMHARNIPKAKFLAFARSWTLETPGVPQNVPSRQPVPADALRTLRNRVVAHRHAAALCSLHLLLEALLPRADKALSSVLPPPPSGFRAPRPASRSRVATHSVLSRRYDRLAVPDAGIRVDIYLDPHHIDGTAGLFPPDPEAKRQVGNRVARVDAPGEKEKGTRGERWTIRLDGAVVILQAILVPPEEVRSVAEGLNWERLERLLKK